MSTPSRSASSVLVNLSEEQFGELLEDSPALALAFETLSSQILSSRFVPAFRQWQGSNCSICLEPWYEGERVILTNCGHYFHPICLFSTLKALRPVCPEYRLDVFKGHIAMCVYSEQVLNGRGDDLLHGLDESDDEFEEEGEVPPHIGNEVRQQSPSQADLPPHIIQAVNIVSRFASDVQVELNKTARRYHGQTRRILEGLEHRIQPALDVFQYLARIDETAFIHRWENGRLLNQSRLIRSDDPPPVSQLFAALCFIMAANEMPLPSPNATSNALFAEALRIISMPDIP